MSYVVAVPELMSAAVTDLSGIESALAAANAAAATRTTEVSAAGADEVSAAIAALFSAHGRTYDALSTQAAAFHDQFIQLMSAGAGRYAAAQAANTSPLQFVQQQLLNVINAPFLTLTGRPLIGDGANGAPGTGANGGAGGWLIGNGGAGGPAG